MDSGKKRIAVIFYTTYGHQYKMATSIMEGIKAQGHVEVDMFRIQETLSDEILGKMHALEARKQWEHVPVITPEKLKGYDGIAFGSPTRFGACSA